MPRIKRQLSQSKIYHVMLRGNERRKIFLSTEDREKFVNTLREKNREKAFTVLAYCLMDNHIHLLINEGQEQISRIMQRIGVTYACYFNRKYKRTGHLFQDRFKSQAIENERHLLAALRYIHNNPVKSNIVENPAQYRWSSYNTYVNKHENNSVVIDRDLILSMFSNNEDQAVKLFIEYSNESANDEFMDIRDESDLEKRTLNGSDVQLFISEFLSKQGQPLKKEIRNELIRELKVNSALSIREIANILGINRNIVQRIK